MEFVFDCSEAEIYLFGGCITSWKVPSGNDILFVRPDAVFNKKKPIRFLVLMNYSIFYYESLTQTPTPKIRYILIAL